MKKIEHVAIDVNDIDKSNKLFKKILGHKHDKVETVETEGVVTSFFKCGESKIELVASQNNDSTISKYLSKRSEGIHHIALLVDDIENEMTRLRHEGIRTLNDIPKIGADNKLICFLHPKDTNGVLIELCQEID